MGTPHPAIRPVSGKAGGVIKAAGHKGKPPGQWQFRVSDRPVSERQPGPATGAAVVSQHASSKAFTLFEQQHATGSGVSVPPLLEQHAEKPQTQASPMTKGCTANRTANSPA